MSHLKNTASRRHSCKARLSKPFKHFADRTQGCLVFCTQQRIIYIPHVILSVSAVLWHHFPVSRLLGGWYLAGSMRLMWQCEDAAGTLQEPLVMWCHSRCADRDRALDLPEGPSHHVLIKLHSHPFICFFLNRDEIAKQNFLWAFLPLLVPILLRNLCFESKIPMNNVCPCSCNPWGFLRTEI